RAGADDVLMVPPPPEDSSVLEAAAKIPVEARQLAAPEIRDGSIPKLPAERVKREPARLLAGAFGIEPFERPDDRGVQIATAHLEQSPIGHFLGQRMLERVFELGEKRRLVQELGGLESAEAVPERVVRQFDEGLQER